MFLERCKARQCGLDREGQEPSKGNIHNPSRTPASAPSPPSNTAAITTRTQPVQHLLPSRARLQPGLRHLRQTRPEGATGLRDFWRLNRPAKTARGGRRSLDLQPQGWLRRLTLSSTLLARGACGPGREIPAFHSHTATSRWPSSASRRHPPDTRTAATVPRLTGNWSRGGWSPPPRARPCERSMRTRPNTQGPVRPVTPAINRSLEPRPFPRLEPAPRSWLRLHAQRVKQALNLKLC
ncbi:PREDICTED: uncharacterized protein LOC105571546 [Cercocebus atys]|uniref:uncharacterized protein LOC105571546 n=1 Tax=Cercocebus atys TaxID=9531 RepID=UPI0005F3C842|nr:PREDICTED: uncharacterized protein LOC105571546 [Cercocebus atys]